MPDLAPPDRDPGPSPARCKVLLLCGLAFACGGGGFGLLRAGSRWLRAGMVSPPQMEHTLEAFVHWQQKFREEDQEQDGKQDYGTLEELARVKLMGGHLKDGEYYGYLFQLGLTPARDRWLIVANPIDERRDDPSFAVSVDGYVWASRTRLALTPDCVLPPGLDRADRIPSYKTYMATLGSATRGG